MVSIKLLLIHRPLYHNVLELISSQLGDGSVVLVIYAIQNAIIKTRTELVSLLHSSILRLQFIATHFCILRETFEPLKRCFFEIKRNFTSAFEFSILNYNNWTFLFHFISECSDRCKLYKIAYSNWWKINFTPPQTFTITYKSSIIVKRRNTFKTYFNMIKRGSSSSAF